MLHTGQVSILMGNRCAVDHQGVGTGGGQLIEGGHRIGQVLQHAGDQGHLGRPCKRQPGGRVAEADLLVAEPCLARPNKVRLLDHTPMQLAQALQQVAGSLAISLSQGLITEQTAVRLLGSISARLGVEFDAEKELKAAQGEKAKRMEADNFHVDPTLDQPVK